MSEDASSAPVPAGLSEAEARARLKREGYNELPRTARRTPFRIVLEVMREPMLALLAGGGAVYLVLGDLQEALILLAFAMVSIVITVVQETRTERVLEALRDLSSPRALVVRDGVRKRIAGREVVRGDLIVLSEGDRIPADAVLLQATDLHTDESLLTGESAPVRKLPRTGTIDATTRPGGDDLPFVFSGALVVGGAGIAVVTATGVRSEIGKIGQSLSTLTPEPPRLQAQTRKLVRLFAIAGGSVSVLAVVLYGLFRGGWLDAVLAGIALGMAMLPEEFPVVLTVFMAMGAWRISRAQVLTRRASAIETLGAATVLCTDKTGTLTLNRMSIAELRLKDRTVHAVRNGGAPSPAFVELLRTGILASAPEPFDPMEKAFHEVGARLSVKTMGGAALVRAYGLRPELLAVTYAWRDGDGFVVAAKGAPEAIAGLCGMDTGELAEIKATVDTMAAEGLRVLGVARARFDGETLPDDPQGFVFSFLGLVGLADPLRESVPGAVAQCGSAGIRVVMITGDYPATAQAIARQAGLEWSQLLTGKELEACREDDLIDRVRDVTVFARTLPEQKLRIVNALKACGEIVAMTGDGVNDAPSLKAAHIGVAMGARGTDVAREASSIVLLDDDFGSVVEAVRLGRRIYDNLRKAMGFIFAVHVPVCTLVFEAETEEEDIMRRPPRAPEEPLFSGRLIWWGVLQGVVAFALVSVIYAVAYRRGMPANEVRALTFFSLVTAIVALIFVNRSFSASIMAASRRSNRVLQVVLLGVAAILALTLAWPVAAHLFRFGPLHADDLALALGAGMVVLLILEFFKSRWTARS